MRHFGDPWLYAFDEEMARAQMERCFDRLFEECRRQKAARGSATLNSTDEDHTMPEAAQGTDASARGRTGWVWAPFCPEQGTRRTRRLIRR